MTGEMHPSEVTREAYPLHFAVADALGGTVHPFDQYQGPYVSIGPDIRTRVRSWALHHPRGLGIVRLWFQYFGQKGVTIYNEANDRVSEPFSEWTCECAVAAARSVLDKE